MTSHDDLSPTPSASTESVVDLPIPGVPSDGATLTEVVNSSERDGFVHQFSPMAGASVECSNCSRTFDAVELDVSLFRRLEGASDPDDMISFVAARCPHCAGLGTLVLGYGVNATEEDADVARAIRVPDKARNAAPMREK
jgi:hypothetical protein